MSITIRTAGLEDYLEGGNGRLKFLLTGEAGSGKTRFSAFAPKPIYADCEDGLLSVADRSVPYASIKSESDMDAFLTLLENECRRPQKDRRWETVVIDTIDTYERHVITNYLRAKKRKEMDGWEDWGYLSAAMTSVIARLMLLPMNVIVLCHTKNVKRKGQIPEDQIELRLKGEFGAQLPNEFDFIGMIETEFGAVEGERDIIRTIRWESIPAATWLKFRGGGVKTTPLTFSEADYSVIREGILSRLKDVSPSEVIETVETPEGASEPVEPGPGVALPVAGRATTPATPPAPPAAPAQPPAPPAQSAVPPAPPVAAPPPPAPKPDLTPPVASTEQAVENVKAELGGTVVADTAGVLTEPEPEPEQQLEQQQPAEDDVTTPVATPAAEALPTEPSADTPEEAAAPVVIPEDGSVDVHCGDARYVDSPPANRVPGCGKDMSVEISGGRVVAVSGDDLAQLVEIAGVKERMFLCNGCFADARRVQSTNA